MSTDSERKRRAAAATPFPWAPAVKPDGTIDELDRRTISGVYGWDILNMLVPTAPSPSMTLVEIEFDSGTRYYSFDGVASPMKWYKDQILDIGTISREVPVLPGEYSISDVSIVLSNADLEFSKLKETEPFRNRTVRIKFGKAADGLGLLATVFTGVITTWKLAEAKLELSVRDAGYDKLRLELGGVLSTVDFPAVPLKNEPTLWPIIYGDVTSAGLSATGAVPCSLVTVSNPFRYLVARHECKEISNVYLYGTLLGGGAYSITTSVIDGQTMTFINFTTDQRDTARPDEWEITADVKGITNTGLSSGTLIVNPADQLKNYLVNYAGVAIADIDPLFDAAAAYFTVKAYLGAVAIVKVMTHAEVIQWFLESFNLSFYVTRAGLFGLYVFDVSQLNDVEAIEALTDSDDMLRNTFQVMSQERVASRMQFNYNYQWVKDYFERQPDQIDNSEISHLAGDIRENIDLWCVRDDGTALDVVTERMGMMRENQQMASFELPIEHYDQDLNDLVRISHWQGIGSAGLGYQNIIFRLLRVDLMLEPTSMRVGVQGIRPVLVGNIWRTYFKLGDETEIAATWGSATTAEKLYGYLGDETDYTGGAKGTLDTNDPIKLLY
jgi:hypothetical protein